MQTQLAVLALYPDLVPDPFGPDFKVVSNEIVEWNVVFAPQPTEEELEAGWLSATKKAKVKEFQERAKTLAGEVWLDAVLELADAPKGGAPGSMPNVTQLKAIRSKLGRAQSAAQAVDPSKHNGDSLKAAKAVEDLKWEDQ